MDLSRLMFIQVLKNFSTQNSQKRIHLWVWSHILCHDGDKELVYPPMKMCIAHMTLPEVSTLLQFRGLHWGLQMLYTSGVKDLFYPH